MLVCISSHRFTCDTHTHTHTEREREREREREDIDNINQLKPCKPIKKLSTTETASSFWLSPKINENYILP